MGVSYNDHKKPQIITSINKNQKLLIPLQVLVFQNLGPDQPSPPCCASNGSRTNFQLHHMSTLFLLYSKYTSYWSQFCVFFRWTTPSSTGHMKYRAHLRAVPKSWPSTNTSTTHAPCSAMKMKWLWRTSLRSVPGVLSHQSRDRHWPIISTSTELRRQWTSEDRGDRLTLRERQGKTQSR